MNTHDLLSPQSSLDSHRGFMRTRSLIAPLGHLGAIRVAGVDAADFLHSQLTQDIKTQTSSQARLAALCNAKGRMLADFLIIKSESETGEPEIRLVLSRDLVAGISKRLTMYVLRSKVSITEQTSKMTLFGLSIPDSISPPLAVKDRLPLASYGVVQHEGITWIMLPSLPGMRRWLATVPAELAGAFWRDTSETCLASSAEVWRWLDVRTGIARIETATQERFIPQMVNFELVGGVSFKKGCYPGQEIVARSQYLGKLRRRSFLVHGNGSAVPLPGTDVHVVGKLEAAGIVVNAEVSEIDGFDALVELPQELLQQSLRADNIPLAVLDLPYPMPDPSEEHA
jgi:folate-binding protein YgfZ